MPFTDAGGTVCALAHLEPGQVELVCDPWGGHGSVSHPYGQRRQQAFNRFLQNEPVVAKPSK